MPWFKCREAFENELRPVNTTAQLTTRTLKQRCPRVGAVHNPAPGWWNFCSIALLKVAPARASWMKMGRERHQTVLAVAIALLEALVTFSNPRSEKRKAVQRRPAVLLQQREAQHASSRGVKQRSGVQPDSIWWHLQHFLMLLGIDFMLKLS